MKIELTQVDHNITIYMWTKLQYQTKSVTKLWISATDRHSYGLLVPFSPVACRTEISFFLLSSRNNFNIFVVFFCWKNLCRHKWKPDLKSEVSRRELTYYALVVKWIIVRAIAGAGVFSSEAGIVSVETIGKIYIQIICYVSIKTCLHERSVLPNCPNALWQLKNGVPVYFCHWDFCPNIFLLKFSR